MCENKFDVTKPVQTRDGRKARIICTDKKGGQPLAVLVLNSDEVEIIRSYSADGKYSTGAGQNNLDLINIPPVKKWRWVFKNDYGDLEITGGYYSGEEEFKKRANARYRELVQKIDSTEKEFPVE